MSAKYASRVTTDRKASKAPLPPFIPPLLATLVAAPFDDPDWQFEIKWDGFRVEAVVEGTNVRLRTRKEQDAARYFGPFLEPPTWLSARQAIVDGEGQAAYKGLDLGKDPRVVVREAPA